jgi:hypothetical protein
MSALTPRLALYFGLDIVEHLALQNGRLLGHQAGHFFKVADITRDPLPRADAILSRNVLTHLSNAQVHAALRNFAASGARFLIASAHDGVVQNQETQTGVWRPLDLTRAPFHLPPPVRRIEDGKGRWLAVYPLQAHE